MAIGEFSKLVQTIHKIKKQEIILPIARMHAVVFALTVGDDLSLRSSLVGPGNYDKEIIKLIYDHTEFVTTDNSPKINYEKFLASVSNIDKICLLWALYKSTYETLGEREVACPKPGCDTKIRSKINLSELIQNDTFTPWEIDTPFYDYVYPIQINYEGWIYTIDLRLQSIRDNNRMLSMLSTQDLQKNMSASGALFSKSQLLGLMTKRIGIKQNDDSEISTNELHEIMDAYDNYIPLVISDEIISKYNEHFTKYVPKFYKMLKCDSCGHEFKYEVDIESEFFRRSILNET